MALDDLLNLMWSALEIDRGSQFFFQTLEAELAKRVRGIKDEQFETLIGCFQGAKADLSMNIFSQRFLTLVLNVIREKKDKFALRTLVQVIWACARIDFSNDKMDMIGLLKEFAEYERLVKGLPTMY